MEVGRSLRTIISEVRRGQNFIQGVFSTLRKILKKFQFDLLCHRDVGFQRRDVA